MEWKIYDIELIRLCKNGLEAYNAILDESPDIVLTGIRMPHMDGLQLIKNISEMGLDTQFIILSGYGEFENAKTAMEYGVKHYLLKPCNEHQIVECIQKTVQDCYRKKLSMRMGKNQFFIANSMQHSVISCIINDTIFQKSGCLDDMVKNYEQYMNVNYVSRKFFKDTGVKFSHYLSDVRIKRAKQYLASNEADKIQDIAQLVGYGNNPQYFSHLFKKAVGMTPSAFNRSLYQTAAKK